MKEQKSGVLSKVFSSKKLNSTVTSANTTGAEAWLGYFTGPCCVSIIYCMLGGSYLTQFYTDVLGMSGAILVLMPFFSKIVDAITNILMGRIIDRTRTGQGKARPWILMSGVFIMIAGILLYTVPKASQGVQIVWIVVSYNLFYAFAYTVYNMSHILMVPLSTRNTKQRDSLALLSNAGVSMIPGMIGNLIMPYLIRMVGVGSAAQAGWIKMMCVLSVFALPGVLLEYYFTKERVTEEAIRAGEFETNKEVVSFREQIRVAWKNPYWKMVLLIQIIFSIQNFLGTNSMVYYCNWVLADSVSEGANMQFLVNVIGQAPLGFGILALWPLVRKFGKRRVMRVGFTFSAIGSLIVVLVSHMGIGPVLGGLILRSIGGIPCYIMSAQLAESMDHIEYESGIRVDGLSASIYSIVTTVSTGIGQSILLAGINTLGYVAPASSTAHVTQNSAMQNFFIFCFAGANVIGNLLVVWILRKYDIEEKMPMISAEIASRRKAEAEARGEVYLTPEELAAKEAEESERMTEENRIRDLKARCEKKGLSFEAEEAKYQAKLAAQKQKEAEKKAKAKAKKASKAAGKK